MNFLRGWSLYRTTEYPKVFSIVSKDQLTFGAFYNHWFAAVHYDLNFFGVLFRREVRSRWIGIAVRVLAVNIKEGHIYNFRYPF
jgi:hypothetical protein